MRLANKVAIITGAGSGIGRATSILFAKEGAKVVVADIVDSTGEETARIIKADGGDAIFVHTDVTKAVEVERLIKTAVETFGKVDILHNNSGVPERPTPIEALDEAVWDHIYAVNAKGLFLEAKYVVPEMKRNGGGVIIHTGAMGAVRIRPLHHAYSSSKGAAIVLTKSLAIELAPYKIRVNCINPVSTETAMSPLFLAEGADMKEVQKRIISTIPLGRLARVEDTAYAALYLASDESSMVTGIALDVDGGRGI
ncbi:glucose 1-dehydrogenase [Chloroflexota bacterium]